MINGIVRGILFCYKRKGNKKQQKVGSGASLSSTSQDSYKHPYWFYHQKLYLIQQRLSNYREGKTNKEKTSMNTDPHHEQRGSSHASNSH